MSLTVSLWSKKEGEIRKFLEEYYESEVFLDDDVDQWSYVYNKPLESVDIISALMDNNHKYDISIGIQVGEGEIYTVTEENHNDVIKGIFVLFYDESQARY